jgi:hypothetical protein
MGPDGNALCTLGAPFVPSVILSAAKNLRSLKGRLGVPVRTLPFLLAPSHRGISGETFALAASVLLSKWAARGLDPDVLAAIRTEVFDIGAPVGPCP